jgi:hypothetical protein
MDSTARRFYDAYWINNDKAALLKTFTSDAKIRSVDCGSVQTPEEFVRYLDSPQERGHITDFNISNNGLLLEVFFYSNDMGYLLKLQYRFTYDTVCDLNARSVRSGKITDPRKWIRDPKGKITTLVFSVEEA